MTNKPLSSMSLLAAAAAWSTAACSDAAEAVNEVPITCRPDALTPAEREREEVLVGEHLASVRETRELLDGYAFRYGSDPALFARMAELVGLEHRCCPFLDFELEWRGASADPWLRITGGARVKEFLADAFGSGARD
ncbi:MAG: hypothetical protein ACREI7_08320 [Myxococcota bacterium]